MRLQSQDQEDLTPTTRPTASAWAPSGSLSALASPTHCNKGKQRAGRGTEQQAALGEDVQQGCLSIAYTVTNNTGQTLVLDEIDSWVGDGCSNDDSSDSHWGTRSQAQLADGQSETLTGYTNEPGGFKMSVTFDVSDGEFAVFSVTNELGGSNSFTADVFDAAGNSDNAFLSGTGAVW